MLQRSWEGGGQSISNLKELTACNGHKEEDQGALQGWEKSGRQRTLSAVPSALDTLPFVDKGQTLLICQHPAVSVHSWSELLSSVGQTALEPIPYPGN